ncbi:hypothetical protein N1032_27900, partial [Herbiconiux sp. CPCC 203386]|nr:hypothetical protein [Herbiconiux daphne]
MRKHFQWEEIFALAEGEPVKATTNNGIEFRCSYKLAGASLAQVAKNLTTHKVRKLEGDLDYELVRHHATPLTEQEMMYCNNDIEIILAYIKEQLIEYKSVNMLPLTNTGRVREYVRKQCFGIVDGNENANQAKSYRKRIGNLRLTPD